MFFTYQEPWVPRHRCAKGKTNYIEVFSKRESKDEEGEPQMDVEVAYETADEEPSSYMKKNSMLPGVPRFHIVGGA